MLTFKNPSFLNGRALVAIYVFCLVACALAYTNDQRPFDLHNTKPTAKLSNVAANLNVNVSTSGQDCGYIGITQSECEERNCRWKPVDDGGKSPWCTYKSDGADAYTCEVDVTNREDCGYFGINESWCAWKNCCWNPRPDIKEAKACFYRHRRCSGYTLLDEFTSTSHGLTALLHLVSPCEHYGQDLTLLNLNITFETPHRLRIKITDAPGSRYEIPEDLIPAGQVDLSTRDEDRLYRFEYTANPFTFKVARKDDGEVVFDSAVPGMDSLVYERQYLEISTRVAEEAHIYGLGEALHSLKMDHHWTRQTMWARDAASPLDENVYGSHPFYLALNNGKAHGVFLRNSNAMDVFITSDKLTWKVVGGVLDFYVFLGPTPDAVIDQYTEIVGRPAMPPYWALGFHHSRYGFQNIDAVEAVVRGYREHGIPLEAIWLDIDYMDRFRDFTLDPNNFPAARVSQFLDSLHAAHQKAIAIIDPGIKVERGYTPYESGIALDIFIKNAKGKALVGNVWPGYTVFPDFLNEKTQAWWEGLLHKWMKEVPVDGIWIDMNEVASWCDGECLLSVPSILSLLPPLPTTPPSTQHKHTYEDVLHPPYRVYNTGKARAPLNTKTLAVDAVHANGLIEYDVHNLYGHAEAMATRKALLSRDVEGKRKRPFVLTRSTFSGTGAHAAHWLGDNWSNWLYLYLSMPGIMNFQLFGIPFTGPDICGFSGDTTEELCLRWMQLGAFFPFSRNHNAIGMRDQEPYRWESVANVSRAALLTRYALLPYIYTLFRASHIHGTPVWRPLFFDFPSDPEAPLIDRQVLLGKGILLSPALNPGQTSVYAYFPPGRWYNYHTLTLEVNIPHSEFRDLYAPLDVIPVHLRGGVIVPMQGTALTTTEARKNDYYLLVPLNDEGRAEGTLYLDDGESEDVKEETSEVTYSARVWTDGGEVRAQGRFGYFGVEGKLNKIVVLGIELDEVMVNGRGVVEVLVEGQGAGADIGVQVKVDAGKGMVVLEGMKIDMAKESVVRWKFE